MFNKIISSITVTGKYKKIVSFERFGNSCDSFSFHKELLFDWFLQWKQKSGQNKAVEILTQQLERHWDA